MSLTDDRATTTPVVVPDGVEYVEPEVRELARGIAADIRKYGHWQMGVSDCDKGYCVVTSPTYQKWHKANAWDVTDRLASLLTGTPDLTEIWSWNDSTPTADVLAALDRIAEGLVER